MDLAFAKVDKVLRVTGLRGWEDVYLIRWYHVDIDSSFDYCVQKLKEHILSHRPTWTSLAVPRLAFSATKIEIEVEAIKHE